MKEQLFDFTIMGLISIFAIDMTADRLYAAMPEPYDELEAFIQQSEKTMQKSATMIKAASKKQEAVEKEIVENVEALEETVIETQAQVEDMNIKMEMIKEATEEINQQLMENPEMAKSLAIYGLDKVIESKTKVKMNEIKLQKAMKEGNDSIVEELIYMKNFYEINSGVNPFLKTNNDEKSN